MNTNSMAMDTDCRHIAQSDNGFKARMRFHQSWYRHHILGLSPGTHTATKGLYGNILREEDALSGSNFLTSDIADYVEQRIPNMPRNNNFSRLRCNLLSSQPMCFNLFARLAMDHELAARLMRTLPGLPDDLTVTDVVIEFAPDPAAHLQDKTAFDAWVEYVRPNDIRGFIGIETKLTESFSATEYDFSERYAQWLTSSSWWWKPGSEEHFPDKKINQLWRNHLLAFSMLYQPDSSYDEAYGAVLYHDFDHACARSIAAYRPLLTHEAAGTLLDWPLSLVISRWRCAIKSDCEQEWLDDLNLRYCDLAASQAAWDAFIAS